ncbi:MAG: nucleotidyltransferase domain-containing protein [Nanoarchaeota archaeon]|nr:nucleotidyltransferase domain-containing protein [Nanoarchaeota archaeon]MBU1631634.1 nucleotidyltransferase domain-containing protein [Nanoarchaeota archaeon]MBU1875647.1 nucleotidyltransferase domain-containing protein [Nanoarchaeota archaeon]
MWKKQNIWLLNRNKIKKWIQSKKVIDVIVFGSLVRGKSKPNDFDICMILKEEQEKEAIDLVDSLAKSINENNLKVQVNFLLEGNFVKGNNSLVKNLLVEGFSVKHNKELASVYGFRSKALFFYDIKKFKPSERVRFHYLLRGRYEQKGLLANYGAELVKDGLIEVPICCEDMFKEIFGNWKLDFKVKRVLFES